MLQVPETRPHRPELQGETSLQNMLWGSPPQRMYLAEPTPMRKLWRPASRVVWSLPEKKKAAALARSVEQVQGKAPSRHEPPSNPEVVFSPVIVPSNDPPLHGEAPSSKSYAQVTRDYPTTTTNHATPDVRSQDADSPLNSTSPQGAWTGGSSGRAARYYWHSHPHAFCYN